MQPAIEPPTVSAHAHAVNRALLRAGWNARAAYRTCPCCARRIAVNDRGRLFRHVNYLGGQPRPCNASGCDPAVYGSHYGEQLKMMEDAE